MTQSIAHYAICWNHFFVRFCDQTKSVVHLTRVPQLQDSSADALHAYCSKFGELEELELAVPGANGKPRGFSFVRFASQRAVDAVLEQPQHLIRGSMCTVRPAQAQAFDDDRRRTTTDGRMDGSTWTDGRTD